MAQAIINRHIDFSIRCKGLPFSENYEAALYMRGSDTVYRTTGTPMADEEGIYTFLWSNLTTAEMPSGSYTLEIYDAITKACMVAIPYYAFVRETNYDRHANE